MDKSCIVKKLFMKKVEEPQRTDLVELKEEKSLWTKKQVRNAVVKGIITADEYYEITGELY